MATGSTYRILVVDDDQVTREMIATQLPRYGYDVLAYATMAEALENSLQTIDVVITRLLIEQDGMLLCQAAHAAMHPLPVIMLTDVVNMEIAIASVRIGAFDFLVKPIQISALAVAVERALIHAARYLTPTQKLVGESAAMLLLRDRIAKLGPNEAPVLISGESGSGRELVARGLHAASSRANGLLFAVNCATAASDLFESTLFGYARGGTMFLDEIGELPLELQAKLVLALQERAGRTPLVRIIASTRHDLAALVAAGTFREDLYFRIHVLHIAVPPLRARGGDVLVLGRHFASKPLSTETEAALAAYSWPGNVRELEGAIEHATALASGERLELVDLPERVRIALIPIVEEKLLSLAELERQHVHRVLESCKNNKAAAARVLGIERKTLYRMLDRWSTPPTPTVSN